jgi:hypothetical protein
LKFTHVTSAVVDSAAVVAAGCRYVHTCGSEIVNLNLRVLKYHTTCSPRSTNTVSSECTSLSISLLANGLHFHAIYYETCVSNWENRLWSFVRLGVSLEFVQVGVYFLELCPVGSIFFGVLSSLEYLLRSFVQLGVSSLGSAHSLEFDQMGVSSFEFCRVGVSLEFVQLGVSFFFGVVSN